MPGFSNNIYGRGRGTGFGRGANFGWGSGGFRRRNCFFVAGVPGRAQLGNFVAPFQQADRETEKQALKTQAEYLQSEMDAIQKRLNELTAAGQSK
jgi:hypothetical protein